MEIIKKSKKHDAIFQYNIQSGTFWGYRLKYYDFNNKRKEIKKRKFKSEHEAFADLIEVQSKINKGKLNHSQITLSEWFRFYIDINKPSADGRKGNWSINTLKNRESVFRDYIDPSIGHIRLDRITLTIYQKTFIEKYKDTLKPSTLRLYHKFVVIALNAAIKHDKIDKNPIIDATLPLDREVQEDKFISIKELKTVLDYVNEVENITNKVAVFTLAYTGIRVGELRALRWKNLDFTNNKIQVYATYHDDYTITKGKNKRIIPVDASLIEQLKEYRKWCINRKGGIMNGDDYVFISAQTGQVISKTHMYQVFLRINKNTGIKITPHTMRHTHSALLISQNQPLKAISKRLGNSEEVLSMHYGHVIDAVDQSVMESFNAALTGADTGANSKSDNKTIDISTF